MNIISDFNNDVRHLPHHSGGYEWWYFDGISKDDRFSFVIIIYEGNPFSTRYNGALLDGKNPMPEDYPAISISIYEDGNPVYYSFTEFDKSDCSFSGDRPFVKIGAHEMEGILENGSITYNLRLEEALPSGDRLAGTVTFKSPHAYRSLFTNQTINQSAGHTWNLVQPRADVDAEVRLEAKNEHSREINFTGSGYHDHNTGGEPMRDEFEDWSWGRFHFDYATLVYYVMNRRETEQHQAWLISNKDGNILKEIENVVLEDQGLTLFGLKPARKIILQSDDADIQIQQSQLLDNGPFYQRYQSDAFLQIPEEQIVESVSGMSEYIKPDRIYSQVFWPFVNMRIHYKAEGSHWVQRSKRLYRWTW